MFHRSMAGSRLSFLKAAVLLVIFAAIIVAAFASQSDASSSGECGDGIQWSLDDSGTLSISGSGPMYDYSSGCSPWAGSTVKSVEMSSGITHVGSYSFEGCSISMMALPVSVTFVGEGAFAGCQALMVINMPSVTSLGKEVFAGDANLMSVNIPYVAAISEGLFNGCSSLMSVNMPSAVSIGDRAFAGCSSLSSFTVPAAVVSIGEGVFSGCSFLRSINVESGNVAFSSVDGVLFDKDGTELVKYPDARGSYAIPSTVKGIADGAFSGTVPELEIPGSVETIGPSAFDVPFYNFDGKTLLEISAESLRGFEYVGSAAGYVRVIEDMSFTMDGLVYKITSVSPAQVAVSGWSGSLGSVVIPSEVRYSGVSLQVTKVMASAFKGCRSITNLNLGGVSLVDTKAFANCYNLRSVAGGPSLTTIGPYAFYGCNNLYSVDLQKSSYSLKAIRQYAFYGCPINNISIPSSVNVIGDYAFSVKFYTEKGNSLNQTVDNLAGYSFKTRYYYNDLYRQATTVGKTFSRGAFTYKVTSFLPMEVAVTGMSGSSRVADVMDYVEYGDYKYKVCSVASNAFSGCESLVYIDLRGVTSIGTKAFYGCSALKGAIMENVVKIGSKAFARCTSLSDIEFEEGLTTIGSYAFYDCPSLRTIEFPDSLKSIEASAFNKCPSVKEISFGDGLTDLGASAFGGLKFFYGSQEISGDALHLTGHVFEGKDGRLVTNVSEIPDEAPPLPGIESVEYVSLNDDGSFNPHMTVSLKDVTDEARFVIYSMELTYGSKTITKDTRTIPKTDTLDIDITKSVVSRLSDGQYSLSLSNGAKSTAYKFYILTVDLKSNNTSFRTSSVQ
ncbi:MAG: leucine-rich repeat domain-containing protein, partial [Candidatus Methanomethylophilaceae archaeon]|nr:leucine-rich repeat domain-containing protein [Candidatus Methanomethylophilaceae archaeon]